MKSINFALLTFRNSKLELLNSRRKQQMISAIGKSNKGKYSRELDTNHPSLLIP